MRFAATLANSKHVGNAFAYLNLFLQTKRLHDCYANQWHLISLYISSTFTKITIFSILTTSVLLYGSNVFFFFHVLFLKPSIFCFFFISILWMNNSIFTFKNKNCRVYHECTFEFSDWLIWLIHQFWLVRLNNNQLVQTLLTSCY